MVSVYTHDYVILGSATIVERSVNSDINLVFSDLPLQSKYRWICKYLYRSECKSELLNFYTFVSISGNKKKKTNKYFLSIRFYTALPNKTMFLRQTAPAFITYRFIYGRKVRSTGPSSAK